MEKALQASKKNRIELEKVLEHYDSRSDLLKYKAACFLIENMIDKYSLDTASVCYNQPYYDNLIAYKDSHNGYGATGIYDVCDSLNNIYATTKPSSPKYTYDLETVTSEFLINHIDDSFDAWNNSPWKESVDFDDFCRFILPYRISTSYWDGAATYFKNIYSGVDTLFSDKGYLEAGKYIYDDIDRNFARDGQFFNKYTFMLPASFRNILYARMGECIDFNSTAVTALRSMGIPATINTIPYWGNSNASHFWTEIKGKHIVKRYENSQLAFHCIEDELINDSFWFKGDVINDTTGIPKEVNIRTSRTVPKVYRINYEIQRSSLACQTNEDIPRFFKRKTLEDVTKQYIACMDVKINISDNAKFSKYVYLCCYNPGNLSWTAIDWAETNKDKAVFHNIGINILYTAAFYKGDIIYPFGDPFILLPSGKCRYLKADTTSRHTGTMYSKVPLRTNQLYYATRMQGGKIIVANKKDLSDTTTVYNINEVPYYMQEVDIENAPSARFVIYRNVNIPLQFVAELEFYRKDDNGNYVKLTGREIGNFGLSIAPLHSAFDGNRESYCYFDINQKEQYIGLDLVHPQKITRIKYLPRNDDNAIVPGEMYELYYWDGVWKSLGKKEGRSDYRLIYDNIPMNALLRIHNHTRGKEHRPFTMENGKQVWF